MIGHLSDTICAVSTPKGKGAIAIIRISGPDCFEIASKIFRSPKAVADIAHSTLAHGEIVRPESSDVIDDVLISKFVSQILLRVTILSRLIVMAAPILFRRL
jgi:tRNA U34 5-carboxymethylaminomethyl modifying GTPase MnmE/TrmE